MNLSDVVDYGRSQRPPRLRTAAAIAALTLTGACHKHEKPTPQSEHAAAVKRADELNADAVKNGRCERYQVADPPAEQVPQPDYSACKLGSKIESYDPGPNR